jgi:hypothetical protein
MIWTVVVNEISFFKVMGGISINPGYDDQEGERFKVPDALAFYIVFQKPARVMQELSKSKKKAPVNVQNPMFQLVQNEVSIQFSNLSILPAIIAEVSVKFKTAVLAFDASIYFGLSHMPGI